MLDRDYKDYRIYVESIADNLPETLAMWRAHWHEQREEDLRGVTFNPDVDGFIASEKTGAFKYITIRQGALLVGHFGLRFGKNRNTSQLTAGDDFFYIQPEHRKGMLAVKLIKFARDFAFSVDAEEFSVSYRVSVDDLDPLLRRCGMHQIARVYQVRR